MSGFGARWSGPDVRAFVNVMGALESLPTDRARSQVLQFVADHFTEKAE